MTRLLPKYSDSQIREFFQKIYNLSDQERDNISFIRDVPGEGSTSRMGMLCFYQDLNTGRVIYVKNQENFEEDDSRYSLRSFCDYEKKTPCCDGRHAHAVLALKPVFEQLKEKLGRKYDLNPKTILRRDPVTLEGLQEYRTILIMAAAEGDQFSPTFSAITRNQRMDNDLTNIKYSNNKIEINPGTPHQYDLVPTDVAKAFGQLLALNELILDRDIHPRHIFYDNEINEAVWIDLGQAFSPRETILLQNHMIINNVLKLGEMTRNKDDVRKALVESMNNTRKAIVSVLEQLSAEEAEHIFSIKSRSQDGLGKPSLRYAEELKSAPVDGSIPPIILDEVGSQLVLEEYPEGIPDYYHVILDRIPRDRQIRMGVH